MSCDDKECRVVFHILDHTEKIFHYKSVCIFFWMSGRAASNIAFAYVRSVFCHFTRDFFCTPVTDTSTSAQSEASSTWPHSASGCIRGNCWWAIAGVNIGISSGFPMSSIWFPQRNSLIAWIVVGIGQLDALIVQVIAYFTSSKVNSIFTWLFSTLYISPLKIPSFLKYSANTFES